MSKTKIILDPTAQTFIDSLEAKKAPALYTLSPQEARTVLLTVQSGHVDKRDADIEDLTITGGPTGKISMRIVRPKGTTEALPVVVYCHGGGWILGDKETHDRLIRDLAYATHAAIIFVNYTPSPEARYPIAVEEAYGVTNYIAENGRKHNLDSSRLAIAGDSVGGNMAIAVTLLAKERGRPKINFQALFYPVTDANFETPSYKEFAEGPWLTKKAMEWFWNAYEPDVNARKQITASPLQASIEQLRNLPPALIITDENDVLQDEGESYARKLFQADVPVTAVRYLGMMHDFMMLNPLSKTPSVRSAIDQASQALKKVFAKS